MIDSSLMRSGIYLYRSVYTVSSSCYLRVLGVKQSSVADHDKLRLLFFALNCSFCYLQIQHTQYPFVLVILPILSIEGHN